MSLVVLAAPVAAEWTALLQQGEHSGLAAIVVGEWPEAHVMPELDQDAADKVAGLIFGSEEDESEGS